MRNKKLSALQALFGPLILLAGCSHPAPAPEPEKPAVASTPAPSTPASAPPVVDASIAANVGDPAKFREFVATLQEAIKKHDPQTVARLVSYPIDINPRTKTVLHIRTPADFIAHYDQIVTPHIAAVVADQKYDSLFVNAQGAMFGTGELWIAGVCKDKSCSQTDIKIRTIQNTEGAAK